MIQWLFESMQKKEEENITNVTEQWKDFTLL